MFWAELRLAVTLLTVIPLPERRAGASATVLSAPEPVGTTIGADRMAEAEVNGGGAGVGAAGGQAGAGVAGAGSGVAGGGTAATGIRSGVAEGGAGGAGDDGLADTNGAANGRDGLADTAAGRRAAAGGVLAPGGEPAGAAAGDLRRMAGAAMEWAPAIGLVMGLAGVGVLWLAEREGGLGPLLSAVLAIAALAGLSGGLHLDGLADLADGLGSRRPAEDALAIMKKSDIGPFGVVALVLVLLVQVAALARAVEIGRDAVALVAAVVTARLAMTAACRRGVPPARGSGLGALVAGSVPRPVVAGLVVVDLAAAAAFGWVFAVGVAAGLAASAGLTALAVRRLGGITGDVLGAIAEVTMAVCLLFCLVR